MGSGNGSAGVMRLNPWPFTCALAAPASPAFQRPVMAPSGVPSLSLYLKPPPTTFQHGSPRAQVPPAGRCMSKTSAGVALESSYAQSSQSVVLVGSPKSPSEVNSPLSHFHTARSLRSLLLSFTWNEDFRDRIDVLQRSAGSARPQRPAPSH